MNPVTEFLHTKLYWFYGWLVALSSNRPFSWFINLNTESVIEDFHIEEYVAREWGQGIFEPELEQALLQLIGEILDLYHSLPDGMNYNVNEHVLAAALQEKGLQARIDAILPKIQAACFALHYDIIKREPID